MLRGSAEGVLRNLLGAVELTKAEGFFYSALRPPTQKLSLHSGLQATGWEWKSSLVSFWPICSFWGSFWKTSPGRTDPSEDNHVRMRATTREGTSSSVFTSYSVNCLEFRMGLGKLWAYFANTVIAKPLCVCTLSACFALEGQNWVVAKESIWPAKPKIFTAWLFTEKVSWL